MRHGSRLRVGVVVATVVAAGVLASEAWAPPRYADLRVAVSAAPAAPSAGQVVVFTVRVHNAGPDSALETMLRYRVDGADVVRAVATQGTCAAGACALGLMGYRNAAHDARATLRLLVRTAEPRAIDVEAAASSASLAMEIEPDNTSAHASVSVVPYAGPRPAADLALALVSLRARVAVLRVTNHGPDVASAVAVAGTKIGDLPPGGEQSIRVRYRRAGRYVVVVRGATADASSANDRVAFRVR